MTAIYLRNFEPVDDPFVARQQDAPLKHVRGEEFPFAGRVFPVGIQRYAYYYAYLPDYVSTPTLDLLWIQQGSSASGSVAWNACVAAITPDDTTRLVDKQLAAANSVTTSALSDGRLTKSTITISNTDSLAAGDFLVVRVERDPSVITCGGTCVLIAASINYTGT
jgi:hypothetical protein